ncbi:MAG TPA: ribonuclease P protein component, partial [Actinomycetota bacterium]|nr:ribonuclease P protein component [Actinomycetota bacterium]
RNGVVVTCAPRPDGGPARVGLSVRRTAGGAVQRNRIKRRLRAAASSCELPPGADFVISGDASVATADFDRLVSAVAEAAAEVGGAR